MAIDLTSPKQASDLLRAHGLRPIKRLGQNFLCDRNTLDRIVRAANITPEDPVLEIGAGLGALTLALASAASRVTSVEIDRQLEPLLREMTSTAANVDLVFEDFLRLTLPELLDQVFGSQQGIVAANIPYYITSPIVERLLEQKHRMKRIVLLVQQEFAARATAAPGADECGSMSLYLQYNARIEIVGVVPRTVFLPPPDVSSAIIAMTPVVPGTVPVQNEDRMFRLIRAGFGQRRKTLVNALMRAPASFDLGFGMEDRVRIERLLALAGIDGGRRGETLSLEEYARLADTPVE
jgi:16S rRNA (adenine1518-N6/adenine1519-N6)-dimethyltransferase